VEKRSPGLSAAEAAAKADAIMAKYWKLRSGDRALDFNNVIYEKAGSAEQTTEKAREILIKLGQEGGNDKYQKLADSV
jgi:hypothetical protein